MEKILVATDGSKNSQRALMKAKEIGTAFNSEITIVHVINDSTEPPYASMVEFVGPLRKEFDEQAKAQAREILRAALEDFKDYKHKVDTSIIKGNPGYGIVEVSEKGDYDLIIIGSRGLGAISRFMLGGVSNRVVNNSKISVLVVK